jgi:hypothetical protein
VWQRSRQLADNQLPDIPEKNACGGRAHSVVALSARCLHIDPAPESQTWHEAKSFAHIPPSPNEKKPCHSSEWQGCVMQLGVADGARTHFALKSI